MKDYTNPVIWGKLVVGREFWGGGKGNPRHILVNSFVSKNRGYMYYRKLLEAIIISFINVAREESHNSQTYSFFISGMQKSDK